MIDVLGEVRATRESPGLFQLEGERFGRGLVAVTGRDAPRWLDGMVSNDIHAVSGASSEPTAANGCYATLLTTKGRIVADLHVLARDDGYWLETAASAVGEVISRLEKYIVADDVFLSDRSGETARLAVEGPGATALLEQATGAALAARPPESGTAARIDGAEVVLARFGFSGEDAWQVIAGAGDADAVADRLREAGAQPRSLEALEVLRVEAGKPLLGAELSEEIFPDEARLATAISRTKGCYTGQEIVARLYSRGAVNHLLVALRFDGERPPAPGAPLFAGDKRTGEVTSACVSPTAGAIGLGYVRRDHEEPGTRLRCEDAGGELEATVAERPIVGSAQAGSVQAGAAQVESERVAPENGDAG